MERSMKAKKWGFNVNSHEGRDAALSKITQNIRDAVQSVNKSKDPADGDEQLANEETDIREQLEFLRDSAPSDATDLIAKINKFLESMDTNFVDVEGDLRIARDLKDGDTPTPASSTREGKI